MPDGDAPSGGKEPIRASSPLDQQLSAIGPRPTGFEDDGAPPDEPPVSAATVIPPRPVTPGELAEAGETRQRPQQADPRWVWMEKGTLHLLWKFLVAHPGITERFPDEATQNSLALAAITHSHFMAFPGEYDEAGLIYSAVRQMEQVDVDAREDELAAAGARLARRSFLAILAKAKTVAEARAMLATLPEVAANA